MSLFVRLATVVTMAFVLQAAPAAVVITAPSIVTDDIAGLETREQGPTAWICTVLSTNSPWISYANIRGYLEGGNAEGKDYTNLVLYPVMELFHASDSRLCVYLPAVDHCYPPAPSNNQVKAVKQLYKKNYYDMRFWGQASDIRVQYYKEKLTAALNAQTKEANFDLFFVSYFSDHEREVRYDIATGASGSSPDTPTESEVLVCPATSGSVMQMAGQEYILTSVHESRLNMGDVVTIALPASSVQDQNDCSVVASDGEFSAFSFVSSTCTLYTFGSSFCLCASGDFEIYVNKDQFGESKELSRGFNVTNSLQRMVIYTEIPLEVGYHFMVLLPTAKGPIFECTKALTSPHYAVFLADNQCYNTFIHDFANCNRVCIGKPFEVLVTTKHLTSSPQPFLSLCGQEIAEPSTDFPYVSHAGHGCYTYEGAKSREEEDCVVTFVKEAGARSLTIIVWAINLNRDDNTCHDFLTAYDGPGEANRLFNGCEQQGTPTELESLNNITLKFHRRQGNALRELNIGFALYVTPPY